MATVDQNEVTLLAVDDLVTRQVHVLTRRQLLVFLSPVESKFLGRLTVDVDVDSVSSRSQKVASLLVLLRHVNGKAVRSRQLVSVTWVVAGKCVPEQSSLLVNSLEVEDRLVKS